LSKDFLSNCSDLFLQVKQNYALKIHFYLFSSWTILKVNFEGSTSRNHLIKIYEKPHHAVPFSVESISAMLHTAQLKIFKLLRVKSFKNLSAIFHMICKFFLE